MISITGLFACGDIICRSFIWCLNVMLSHTTDLAGNPLCNLVASLGMGFFRLRLGYARAPDTVNRAIE